MVRLTINGKSHEVDVDPSTPLLWVIREQIGLTGTKYGCGMAQCGACTVHVNGAAMRSCVMPVSAAVGQKITTIEGLASGNKLHKVQAGLDQARGAAVRLLPVRHDHGRRGAARAEAKADRRGHRRRDHQHLPLRDVPGSARGDPRRSQSESLRRDTMKMNRRSFIVSSAAVTGGLALGFELPFGSQSGPRAGRLARGQRLGGHPAERHRRDPHGSLRNGPGHDHRPRAARRRRARVRLEKGHLRISDAGHEPQAQARLG